MKIQPIHLERLKKCGIDFDQNPGKFEIFFENYPKKLYFESRNISFLLENE